MGAYSRLGANSSFGAYSNKYGIHSPIIYFFPLENKNLLNNLNSINLC